MKKLITCASMRAFLRVCVANETYIQFIEIYPDQLEADVKKSCSCSLLCLKLNWGSCDPNEL